MKRTSGTMRRALATVAFFTYASISVEAQITVIEQNSPQEIVQLFCQADASGKQLTQQTAWEVQPFLAEQNAWSSPAEIEIIKDYRVRRFPESQGTRTQVTVDYNVWGGLDSSFSFTSLGGPLQNQPRPIPEGFELIHLNSQSERQPQGSSQTAGSEEWKIVKYPPEPHISLEEAIRYVRETGFASRSALLRSNAQRTLAELQKLYELQLWSRAQPASFQQTPVAVLAQFAALQTEGRALTRDGVKQFETFFVRQPIWQQGTIHIVKSYSIEDVSFLGNKGNIYLDYLPVGDLDSSMRFTPKSSPDTKVRQAYTLVLQAAPTLPLRTEIASPLPAGPPTWKIESSSLEQWITVNAAVRYVTATRDASSDPAIKMNANATLAILRSIASSPHF